MFLICPANSGVTYTNQVGGHACLHPQVEGFILPFDFSSLEDRLARVLLNRDALTVEDADEVDAMLARFPHTSCATVDRTRLDESMEAWVYVNVVENEACYFSGFGKFSGVMTVAEQ